MEGLEQVGELFDHHIVGVAQCASTSKQMARMRETCRGIGFKRNSTRFESRLPVLFTPTPPVLSLYHWDSQRPRTRPYNTGMATWIAHLRIAENLLGLFPDLDPAGFAVGNIAPDSGIPDEKWEIFSPPLEVTHLISSGDWRCADMEFYRRYLLPLRCDPNQGPVSFRIGYFFHLLTDNIWDARINRPVRKRWEAQFAADKGFIWEVKKDLYGLDFIYVRNHPDCLFWRVFLNARPGTGELDFLPLEAVRQRVEFIQQDYQRTDEDVQKAYNRPYIYLSSAEMDRFVDESTRQLSRIYQHLWINGAATDGFISALDLKI